MNLGRYDYAAFIGLGTYAAASVALPVVLVPLADDLGFSLAAGGSGAAGFLHLLRSVFLVAAMIVSGLCARWFGKRLSMGGSMLLMSVGLVLTAISPNYGMLLVALACLGISEGVIEALATPFVQELHPDEPSRYISLTHSFWSIGIVVTVMPVELLLGQGVSWRTVMAALAVVGCVGAAWFLLPQRSGHAYPEQSAPKEGLWRRSRRILATASFWPWFAAMFVAGGGEFCLTFWSASYIKLSFPDTAWAGGMGLMLFAGGMFVGRLVGGLLVRQRYLRRLLIASSCAGVAVTLALPQVDNLWLFLVLLLVSGLATAPYWPSVQSYAVERLPQLDTTMVLILLSCAGVPGCGFFAWLMGELAAGSQSDLEVAAGLRNAFYLVPACYGTLALIILTDWWVSARRQPISS